MIANLPSAASISSENYRHSRSKADTDREKILLILATIQPATANMISEERGRSRLTNDNVRSRIGELLKRGQIVINHVGLDPVSGCPGRFYRLRRDGEPPELFPERMTLAEAKARIEELEAEVTRLTEQLDDVEATARHLRRRCQEED
jgi:predicted ArsR family transcriptional regulator